MLRSYFPIKNRIKVDLTNSQSKYWVIKPNPPNQSYILVYIDENLSWDCHIKELYEKWSIYNGIIAKLRHYVPKNTLISVHYSLFYSHLSYGCHVWSVITKNNIDSVVKLQKTCIRITNFSSFTELGRKLKCCNAQNEMTSCRNVFCQNSIIKLHVTTICWISYTKWSRQHAKRYQCLMRVTHPINTFQGKMKISSHIEKMLCSDTQCGFQQEDHGTLNSIEWRRGPGASIINTFGKTREC